jgi:hypothetical protein
MLMIVCVVVFDGINRLILCCELNIKSVFYYKNKPDHSELNI